VDRNFNDDKLTIIKPFSTSTTFVFLDYNFDVEQFTSGLPFYNIAKDTNLESFRNLGRGISPDATYPKWDKQVWNAKFTPNANDNANCLEVYSNCQGIIINFNLTLPDPWLGAGGLGWQAICPLAFDKGIEGGKGIDPQYRFLCTEWWVPYGRGWPIQTKFKETLSCTASPPLSKLRTAPKSDTKRDLSGIRLPRLLRNRQPTPAMRAQDLMPTAQHPTLSYGLKWENPLSRPSARVTVTRTTRWIFYQLTIPAFPTAPSSSRRCPRVRAT